MVLWLSNDGMYAQGLHCDARPKIHPQGRKRHQREDGYWLARFAVCPADYHFMAHESLSPLGVYNPPPPRPPSYCPDHIILLVSVDVCSLSPGLSWSVHVGILPKPNCAITADIPICCSIPPAHFHQKNPGDALMTCCCPTVSCRDAFNAAVPTVTLSLGVAQGPSWEFLNEWSWVLWNVAVPILIHTFESICTQTPYSPSQRPKPNVSM